MSFLGQELSDELSESDENDDKDSDPPIEKGAVICANDDTVVKKGIYGKVVDVEPDGKFGTVQWELPNGGVLLNNLKGPPKPERVAFEGRFKYIVEEPSELHPLGLRSGLGAVASLCGEPLFTSPLHLLDRTSGVLSHVVPDLGLLQEGTFLKKQAGFSRAYMYSSSVYELTSKGDVSLVDDEVDDDLVIPEDDDDLSRLRRLSVGQVFFEYKLNSEGKIVSGGLDEMYVYVGLGEEYELHKPTPPESDGKVRSDVCVSHPSPPHEHPSLCLDGQPWVTSCCLYDVPGRSSDRSSSACVSSAHTTKTRATVLHGCRVRRAHWSMSRLPLSFRPCTHLNGSML